VDIEFAWDNETFYLLQCRSLSTRKELDTVIIPEDLSDERILFKTHAGLSNSIVPNIEYIVYVDPKAYDSLQTVQAKGQVAAAVNLLNKHLGDKRFALMGPGRWGSNDINLGVQVTYAHINHAALLVEIAFSRDGLTPEVSYGTHFFQDLVEADIAIVPLFPDDGDLLNERFLLGSGNLLGTVAPEVPDCEEAVRVIHIPSVLAGQLLHVYLDAAHQRGLAFFGPKEKG
jgi:hypothetical protein